MEGLEGPELELFDKYKTKTVDELKDYCRWNNQMISGTKVRSAHFPFCIPILNYRRICCRLS